MEPISSVWSTTPSLNDPVGLDYFNDFIAGATSKDQQRFHSIKSSPFICQISGDERSFSYALAFGGISPSNLEYLEDLENHPQE